MRVALKGIGREEHPRLWVIIARGVVVQYADRVSVLAGEADGSAVGPLVVALLAIGTVHLVALDGRAAGGVAPVGHYTALQVGLVEGGAGPIRFA